ncbi:sigma factor accessory [Bacillus phage JL]|uniref:Sigma factor accessory n=1 Tax=Bacillus phage JL TaxID=1296655 RepID=S5MMC1_9CAUD|nr:sigma factor accessory [Bacillus phage JL]AGR46845.1 sigma factor accessory [Bacillus phage JL]
MKEFLKALQYRSNKLIDSSPVAGAVDEQHKKLREEYKALEGRRGLYSSGSTKEVRVITIVEAHERYLRVSYQCFGMDYTAEVFTCICWNGIFSGEERISDVE